MNSKYGLVYLYISRHDTVYQAMYVLRSLFAIVV